jgi:NADH-quinone oxidoreductase subunit E
MKIFTETTRQEATRLMDLYPHKAAALLPILFLAQKEFGCLDGEAEQAVADLMGVPLVSVHEVVSFYFMFHQHPPGKYHLQVCHNLTCTMMAAESLFDYIKTNLGIEDGQRTEDGLFSLERVECLGACDRAPAMLVNDTLHTDLTPAALDQLIQDLRRTAL